MKRFLKRSAFTIVEMVIVIAVIGILATVMIPTISGMIEKANKSADTQFAASLTIQLAMESVDDDINGEADLRRIVDQYYGEWEGDTLVTSYYDTKLVPKAAKSGNHFWYNVVDGSVVAGDFDYVNNLPGPASATDGVPSEPAAPDFEKANPRTIKTTNGNYFFLMDCSGVEGGVVNQLKALKDVDGNAAYATAIENILAVGDDADLAVAIASKLNKTVLANDKGVFFRTDETAAEQVYVPNGTTMVGPSRVDSSKLTNIFAIHMPSGAGLGSNSFIGFVEADENNDGTLFGTTTIYMNVTKDVLVGGMVSADATNCVVQIPTGERFAFVNGVFTELGTENTFDTEYSDELGSFIISGPVTEGLDHYFSFAANGSTVYYTPEFTGEDSITLVAGNFKNTDGDSVNRTVIWTVNGVEYKGNEITLKVDQLSAAITVTAQNLTYTVSSVPVAVDALSAEIDGLTNEPIADGKIKYEIEYRPGDRWTISSEVFVNPTEWLGVAVNQDVDIALSGSGAGNLELNGNILEAKSDASGAFDATLTVSTKSTDMSGNKKTFVIELAFKAKSATFTVADSANTQGKFGGDYTFTVGTKGTIELGTLFDVLTGEPSSIVVQMINNDATGNLTIDKSSGSDWKKWTITPGVGTAIAISDGGEPLTLPVKVVSDAYNVASLDQWKSASGKICLLKDISLGNDFDTQNKTLSYFNGNMHVIDASQFNYDSSDHNSAFFIKMTSGSFNNGVIVGPVYPEVVLSGSSASGDGYFAPGLRLSGTVTVNNSYVSGFYAPIRVDGGTITIKNSTLEGGISANLYIYNATTVTLDNSATVQRRGGYTETYTGKNNKVIGAGIHLDTKANGTNVVFTGNTVQYNWFAKDDKYSGTVETIRGYLFDGKEDCESGEYEYTYSNFIHNVNGVVYLNMGITQEKESYSITENTILEEVLSVKNYLKGVTYIAWSIPSCGNSCQHDLNPPDSNGDGVYNYLDFIAARDVR